jgi:hypothetical protein
MPWVKSCQKQARGGFGELFSLTENGGIKNNPLSLDGFGPNITFVTLTN